MDRFWVELLKLKFAAGIGKILAKLSGVKGTNSRLTHFNDPVKLDKLELYL